MIHRIHTKSSDQGIRLDNYLHDHLDELSKSQLRKIIDLGGVHIDGRRVRKCSKIINPDQKIEVHRDLRSLEPFRIDENTVVFEDKHIIVLNKPPGVECQPTPARYKGTLFEALQVWLKRDMRFGKKLHIGMSQRLDRDTSGLIVFSIHPQSHKGLSSQFTNRTIVKKYLALVENCPRPPQGTIRSYLAKQRRSNRMKSVEQGGKEAITHFKVLQTNSEFSLVAITLETGRTHQIRVHFSEAGYPLLGDLKYNGKQNEGDKHFTRHCLHSWQLEFNHPITGNPLRFEAELPSDMQLFNSFPSEN